MSKETEDSVDDVQEVDPTNSQGAKQNTPVLIRKQYLKDVSFECPNSPAILEIRSKPQMEIAFNMNAVPLEKKDDKGDVYEVTIKLEATARRNEDVAFIAEIEYGIEVLIFKNVPENQRHPLLYIEIPRYAFPFVRQFLSQLTQMSGFPPLLLTPIDFRSLYIERFGKEADISVKESA
jgi:preprotein translocase subunit SecB